MLRKKKLALGLIIGRVKPEYMERVRQEHQKGRQHHGRRTTSKTPDQAVKVARMPPPNPSSRPAKAVWRKRREGRVRELWRPEWMRAGKGPEGALSTHYKRMSDAAARQERLWARAAILGAGMSMEGEGQVGMEERIVMALTGLSAWKVNTERPSPEEALVQGIMMAGRLWPTTQDSSSKQPQQTEATEDKPVEQPTGPEGAAKAQDSRVSPTKEAPKVHDPHDNQPMEMQVD